MSLYGMRVIESIYLTEDGIVWKLAGRSGWKVKRHAQVPMRGGIQLDPQTLVMHPAMVAELRATLRTPPREEPGQK